MTSVPAAAETRDLVLRTRGSEHRLAASPSGSGIRARWWGEAGADAAVPADARPPSFSSIEDLLPHEYSVAGTRHVAASDLDVARDGGRIGARVRLEGEPALTSTESGDTLAARLIDPPGELRVDLAWETSLAHDVITRISTVTNTSAARDLVLRRPATGSFCLHLPDGVDVTTLTGDWCREFAPRTTRLACGTLTLGSRQGITSHRASPVVTLADPEDPERGVWSIALAWSGSWHLDVDAEDSGGWVRVSAGPSAGADSVLLGPGESFEAPPLLGLWAPDADAAARAWHRYARTALLRDASAARRPVTYNSWYATGFDVRVDQQIALARRAADLGCEEFVLDDGWFRGRPDDTAGLGDWDADPEAFPRGVAELADAVHSLGMRFGLWVEPECVNPDSDLFRAHPDWIYRAEGREPVTMRHQFVLDLGRPEVERWCTETIRDILRSAPIDHLKWDMNRAVSDGGRPGDPHGPEWAIQHARAHDRILRVLRTEFPEVTLEACSGGGGRIDAHVLSLCDVVWPSDETGPRDRLAIQHGFLSAYPATVMSSWATHDDGMRDPRPASLTYRMAVAMGGVPGLGMDLTALTEEQMRELRGLVALAKEVRPLVLDGEVQRHGDPRAHGYAVEHAGDGAADPRVLLLVFGTPEMGDERQGAGEPVRLRPAAATARSHPTVQVRTAGEAAWEGEELVVRLDPAAGAAVMLLGP